LFDIDKISKIVASIANAHIPHANVFVE